MDTTISSINLWRKHIALPQDHGSWVFIFSPLIVGLAASGTWKPEMIVLIAGVMAAFLSRQPLTVIVKIFSGRKPRRDLPAAVVWAVVYGLVGLSAVLILALRGYAYLLYLALPGVPVFVWHLWLVSRRAERRQAGIEIIATGVLALAAPGAYWLGRGEADPNGWLLWMLMWIQAAASIVHAYMRLEQREMKTIIPLAERLRTPGSLTRRAWLYTTFNVIAVIVIGLFKFIPVFLFLPFLVQWVETIYTSFKPAVGVKPTIIGVRQLIISTIFAVVFIIIWING